MLLVRAGLAALEFDPATALSSGRARVARHAGQCRRTNPAGRRPARRWRCTRRAPPLRDATGRALPMTSISSRCRPPRGGCSAMSATRGSATTAIWSCRFSSRRRRPGADMASFFADLKVSLNRLHDPQGHALLFQSLRHGTETTQDLSRSADPVIQALFSSFCGAHPALPRAHRPRHRSAAPSQSAAAGVSTAAGRCGCTASGFHANHVHPRGWISSACYIELPDVMSDARSDEGILTFGEPGIATTPALGAEYSVRPARRACWCCSRPISGTGPCLFQQRPAAPHRRVRRRT